jgi:hypothetical protein
MSPSATLLRMPPPPLQSLTGSSTLGRCQGQADTVTEPWLPNSQFLQCHSCQRADTALGVGRAGRGAGGAMVPSAEAEGVQEELPEAAPAAHPPGGQDLPAPQLRRVPQGGRLPLRPPVLPPLPAACWTQGPGLCGGHLMSKALCCSIAISSIVAGQVVSDTDKVWRVLRITYILRPDAQATSE